MYICLYMLIYKFLYIFIYILKNTLLTLFYVICMNGLMVLGRESTFTTN